jgi:hypothetical protein
MAAITSEHHKMKNSETATRPMPQQKEDWSPSLWDLTI